MEALKVDLVHFYPRENAQAHNTIKFEAVNEDTPKATIVRRGQPFIGIVRFDREYNENEDIIQLIFTLGPHSTLDTTGSIFLKRDVIPNKFFWSARLTQVQGEDVMFEVSTPVNVPIGCWSLRVATRLQGTRDRVMYDYDQDIYILFNPWNPDDQTYMEDTELLQEYVLNDVGKLWVGPIRTTCGKPWFFGQFDAVVLPACMFILDRAEMPYHQRGDPIKLCRIISRIVNSNDDAGVLLGRWDMTYVDGTAPAEWTGSVDILEEYLKTRREVRYGQCWVFAGVVTTVCRALGIPSRVVSNLVSAHDANNSLTVDKYYSENMVELGFDPNNPQGADSIWNYHVWNDVWMARPDLPPGYGGWQAIDATPQEKSSGMYQCGPAPLEAIKHGVIGMNYDVEFMLATVNADLMRWREDSDAEYGYSKVDSDNYLIGRMILTKKPFVFDPNGDGDRQDIIDEYKYREGTNSERLALMNGVRYSERAKRYHGMTSNPNNDISFKLRDIDTVQIGEDFSIIVDIDNNSDEYRRIRAAVAATSVFYNGVRAEVVKEKDGTFFVGPQKHEEIRVLVKAEDYLPKLVEYCNMKISAMAIVDDTKQSWADDDDFQILKPNIIIKFNDDLFLNQPSVIMLTLANPLEQPLTEGEFRVTSSGITGRTIRVPSPDAGPREVLEVELPIVPNKLGTINFVATYKSNELKDIHGAGTGLVVEG